MTDEAAVKINSVTLLPGSVIALRVAVTSMLLDLEDQEYTAKLGPVAEAYRKHLKLIEGLLVEHQVSQRVPDIPAVYLVADRSPARHPSPGVEF